MYEILKEHIESYITYVFYFDAFWDEDEKMQHKRRADTAFNTFRALFCNKKEFESDDSARKYLHGVRGGSSKVV